jgi:hypothetical protein
MAAEALRISPALMDDGTSDMKSFDLIIDDCGFEIDTVDVMRNPNTQNSFPIIRLKKKGE